MSVHINKSFLKLFWLAFSPRYVIPDLALNNLSEINVEKLQVLGIRGIVFDVDQTLTLPGEINLDPSVLPRFELLMKSFACCALSNLQLGKFNYSPLERATRLQDKYNLKIVLPENKKPHPEGFNISARILNLPPNQIAYIGDRVLTDIIGGNYSGFYTILVNPLDENNDSFLIKVIRILEKIIVKIYVFVNKLSHWGKNATSKNS